MKYKIMIVDDEPANLRTLLRLFRQEYQVVTAESGAAALTLLEHHDVALLISDQRMAETTGIELMKKTVALRPQMVPTGSGGHGGGYGGGRQRRHPGCLARGTAPAWLRGLFAR